ncbi:MAG TPA: nucleoside kinase [Thermotogota bacterium]|nr:nucleoside kinase [Thermotogota bacterium]HNT96081.1 nucleoside kinase [Thermotogota bacterium]HQQ66180.1 nucleoside kinase [Thermotogota bacterium]
MIRLSVTNNKTDYSFEKPITGSALLKETGIAFPRPVLGARVNNRIRELASPIFIDSTVEFFDITSSDGFRMVQRGLIFLLYLACKECFPERKLRVLHSIQNSLYCELGDWVSGKEIQLLKEKMRDLVEQNLPFWKETLDKIVALKFFKSAGDHDKVKVFKFRKKSTVSIYHCGEKANINYFYGYMPPSTGCLSVFDLKVYSQGFLLIHPTPLSPDRLPEYKELPKFSQVFLQYQRWGDILEVNNVGDLNECIVNGRIRELIMISEALHEKKIAQIATEIARSPNKRLITIAGPSSSGKTTTSKRLELQLKADGLFPISISLDDYFVAREATPRDEKGEYDFEDILALDLELLDYHLCSLLEGKEVHLPKFDFITGTSKPSGRVIRINKNQPIIIEGIHGLNDKLTTSIPREMKYKIYVSALTQLGIDDINRIPTTDTRLIRRIVRDHHFRGHSAIRTIKMWPSVRRGEEKFIFPFQEDADILLSSALTYELAVLKIYAEPLLVQISEDNYENTEAKRLLKFLEYFLPITDTHLIPPNSILREFIGGSIFDY